MPVNTDAACTERRSVQLQQQLQLAADTYGLLLESGSVRDELSVVHLRLKVCARQSLCVSLPVILILFNCNYFKAMQISRARHGRMFILYIIILRLINYKIRLSRRFVTALSCSEVDYAIRYYYRYHYCIVWMLCYLGFIIPELMFISQ